MAHSAGLSVSALIVEISTATAMVSANSWYSLPVMPGMKPTGTNTASRTSEVARIGLVTSRMACIAASRGVSPCANLRCTFSTTMMASSTTMPIDKTRPNSVITLMLNPSAFSAANVPISETGMAIDGITVIRQFCRNTYTTSTTRISASSSVFTTSLIELVDEARGVVEDAGLEVLREPLRQARHFLLHPAGDGKRVRAGQLIDADVRRRIAVEKAERGVVARAQLDARDVLDPHAGTVRMGADDDVLEGADLVETSQRADCVLELLVRVARGGADLAGGDLHVLFAHRAHDVGGGDAQARHAPGVQPHPHAVVAGAKDRRLPHAGDTRQRVEQVDRRVIAEIKAVVSAVRRGQVDHQQQVGRLLAYRDPLAHDVFGKLRLGERHPVLHVDLGDIGVAADLEGHLHVQGAVVAAGRCDVDHPFDAVDLLLQRLGHGRFHDLRVGPGIAGRYLDDRRRDLRVLVDRQGEERDESGERDEDRDDEGEFRPVDEERAEHALTRSALPEAARSG